jgi:hypothetical protein
VREVEGGASSPHVGNVRAAWAPRGRGDVGAVERSSGDTGPCVNAQNGGETDCSRGCPDTSV